MSEEMGAAMMLLMLSPGLVYLARAQERNVATVFVAILVGVLGPIIGISMNSVTVSFLASGFILAAQFPTQLSAVVRPLGRHVATWLALLVTSPSRLAKAVIEDVRTRYRQKHDADLPQADLIAKAVTAIARANKRLDFDDQVKPLADCIFAYADELPRSIHSSPFAYPVTEGANTPRAVNKMLGSFNWNDQSYALFPELCRTLQQNWTLYSKSQLPTQKFEAGERIWPKDYKGAPKQLVYSYLKNTPLFDLFQAEMPWPMPELARFEHQWVVGLQGSGKTQLLQNQLVADLQRVVDGEVSLIVIDSQGMSDGRLLSNIAKLDLFGPGGKLHDRLVIMDPNEEHPPSLSLFDMGQHSPDLAPDERKRLTISAVSNIAFAISDTTDAMQDMLEYVIQLAMAVPDANIRTLRDILQCKRKQLFDDYGSALQGVDVDVRNYFDHSFFSPGTDITKAALVRRVAGMLRNPSFRAMYLSPRTTFHMAEALEEGKVILINADKGTLGPEYAITFGRYFIAQLSTFVQRRRRTNRAIFCYIDEAHEFIDGDKRIEAMLAQARKQRVGFVLAHQFMRQIKSDSLRDAVASCRLKFAGANEDAVALARYFRTDPDKLDRLKNLTFAAFDRSGSLPMVNITIKPGVMEALSKMTDSQYSVLREDIRKRYSSTVQPHTPEPPQPPQPPKLTDGERKVTDVEYEEVSRKWSDDVR